MKKIFIILLTLSSFSCFSSDDFEEAADLTKRYLIAYNSGNASKADTKKMVSIFAKESESEIRRLATLASNHNPEGVREGKLVYTKSEYIISLIEKKFPAKQSSKLSILAEEMVDICKRDNVTYRLPDNQTTFDNYDLVQGLCDLSGRVSKYTLINNF